MCACMCSQTLMCACMCACMWSKTCMHKKWKMYLLHHSILHQRHHPPWLRYRNIFSSSIETQPQSFKVRPSADSYEVSYTTTLSYHFIQLLHTHTSLGAHKSAHMSAYMSFGAHKSLGAHMSAHTSACIYAFLPWDPICNIPFTLSHKQGNPYLIRMSVTDWTFR